MLTLQDLNIPGRFLARKIKIVLKSQHW